MSSQDLEQGKAWVEKTIRHLARERGAEITKPSEWHHDSDREVCKLRGHISGAEKLWQFSYEQLEDVVNDKEVRRKILRAFAETSVSDSGTENKSLGRASVEDGENLSADNSSPLMKLLAEGLDLSSDLKNDNPREFEIGYQNWYTSALLAIEKLLPLRAREFVHLYDGQPRADLNLGTYRVRDFLLGLIPHGKPYSEVKGLTRRLILQQIQILRSALSESVSRPIEEHRPAQTSFQIRLTGISLYATPARIKNPS